MLAAYVVAVIAMLLAASSALTLIFAVNHLEPGAGTSAGEHQAGR